MPDSEKLAVKKIRDKQYAKKLPTETSVCLNAVSVAFNQAATAQPGETVLAQQAEAQQYDLFKNKHSVIGKTPIPGSTSDLDQQQTFMLSTENK